RRRALARPSDRGNSSHLVPGRETDRVRPCGVHCIVGILIEERDPFPVRGPSGLSSHGRKVVRALFFCAVYSQTLVTLIDEALVIRRPTLRSDSTNFGYLLSKTGPDIQKL